MKYSLIILSLFLSLNALADRPIQSARMGKVGSIHPNAWRISERPDIQGEGKIYTFKVSLYKGKECIDSFDFELNKGAKNSKKSQFSLQGDIDSEKFGNEVSLELLDIENEQIQAQISLKSKVLNSIVYKDKKHIGDFIKTQIEKKITLKSGNTLSLSLEEDMSLQISCF